MRRSGHIESNVLRTEANILHDQLVRKDIEARDWRGNYARLATSPYRKYWGDWLKSFLLINQYKFFLSLYDYINFSYEEKE